MRRPPTILCWGLVVSLGMALYAAQQIPPAYSAPRLAEVTLRPVMDMQGMLIAFVAKARFEAVHAPPSGQIDSVEVGSIEVDLLKTNGTVVIDGVAVDDREAVDQLMAILTREWKKAMPDPLPQRRRTMRAK